MGSGLTTVYDYFARAHALWPDRPMLNVLPETAKAYAIPAGDISYAEAMRRVDDFANRLQKGRDRRRHARCLASGKPS